MSSVSAAFYQTPFKASNFTVHTDPVTLHIMNPNASLSAVMTTTAFSQATDNTPQYRSKSIFKDLGKTIVTVNDQGLHTDKYQLVQFMGPDPDDEGQSGVSDRIEGYSQVVGYVRVWSTYSPTTGNRVVVARTG
jgi:hypothetical protein